MGETLAAGSPRPLDESMAELLAGRPIEALRRLIPALQVTHAPGGLWVAGKALLQVAPGQAEKVLRAAVNAALVARNFPLAAAALYTLDEAGHSTDDLLDTVVELFSRATAQPSPGAPPSLERASLPPTELDDAKLVERVVELAAEDPGPPPPAIQAPAIQQLLTGLGKHGLRAFARSLEPVLVPKGERVLEQGAPGDAAFLVGRGELEVVVETDAGDSKSLARLGAGSLFGEMALLSRSPRAAHVITERPSILLRATRERLDQLAADTPDLATALARFCRSRMISNLVSTSSVLRPLRSVDRKALLARFVPRTFEEGDVVIEAGQEGAGLHLVASGNLRVIASDPEQGDETQVALLKVGDVVGEVAMVLRRPATAQVVAACPAITMHLHPDDFMGVVKEHPQLLAELYELAVERHDETRNLLAQPAADADDLILL